MKNLATALLAAVIVLAGLYVYLIFSGPQVPTKIGPLMPNATSLPADPNATTIPYVHP